MSSGSRVGGPFASTIPANARKVVQDLKEIVKNSDDEIYSMLKECNMDPNETVQRLLSQDTFHEVKRKRDKRKENVIKESGEARSRPSLVGSSAQGGRVADHGNGRGGYVTRYNSEFSGGGRGQPFIGRDNGSYQNGRSPSLSTTSTAAAQPQAQTKTGSSGASGSNTVVVMTTSGLAGLPNGNSSFTRTIQGNRGGWSIGPGQATMADIVKSSNAQQYVTSSGPVPKGSTAQQLISLSSNLSSGVHSSLADPMVQSFSESHAPGPVGFKKDSGLVDNQRLMEEQEPVLSMEVSAVPDSLEQSPHNPQRSSNRADSFSSETDVKVADADVASTSFSSSYSQEGTIRQAPTLDVSGSSEGPTISPSNGSPELAGSRTDLLSNQYNGRLVYQTALQPMGSQKVSGLEWRPRSPVKSTSSEAAIEASSVDEDARLSALTSREERAGMPADSTIKLQHLSLQDDQPVIIPDHLQVPEADQSRLNFGSFGEEFDTPFSTNFASEEDNKSTASAEDNIPAPEDPADQPIPSSLISSAPESFEQKYTSQSTASPLVSLAGGEDIPISMPAPAISSILSRPDVSKSEPVVHQGPGYPYLSAIPNYPGFGVMPQLMGSRYTYEPAESQAQDVSRLPSFVSPYSDPSQNYYSPVFRPGTDVDARYTHFISTNTANKYNTGVTLVTGQGLSSSQEGGNSVVIPATVPTGQTSQTMAQTGLSIPQQPVPMHAYPAQHAGVPFTPFGGNFFGFQYVSPGYGYMPSPYQHSYAGNTGYAQGPGNGYAPAGASAYGPAGAPAIKYSIPQYKLGTGPGNVQHAAAAAGYGSFTSPAGFPTGNPAATTATASGYDDVSGAQYKENNLYIPSQQAEGSTVWIQTQPSRDMTGMQTNSFYNMLGQGQHTGYPHTQPTHAVPAAAYANLYHQSQSGTAPPAAHQLLQQPQALGAVGVGSAQSGSYQQPQRGQLSWANGY